MWLDPGPRFRIRGIHLAYVGEFNGGRVKLTEQKMDGMARTEFPPRTHRPKYHIGHPDPDKIGEQRAIGAFERLYRVGDEFYGDLVNVTPWDASLILETGPFSERSMELARDGDGYEMLACGSLGSSAPGIPGMKPITAAMCELMDESDPMLQTDREVLYLSAAGRETFTLSDAAAARTQDSPEEEMELSHEQKEALKLELMGEVKEMLAEKDKEIETLSDKLAATETRLTNTDNALKAAQQLSDARSDVDKLSRSLQDERRVSPAGVDPQTGNLEGVLLHARTACPPMQIDGKPVPFFDALSRFLQTQPSANLARSLSIAPKPAAPQAGKSEDEMALSRAKAYAAEHKCSLAEAVAALAREEVA